MLCLDLNNPITSRFDLTLVIKSSLVCFDDQLTQFSENCHGPQNRDPSIATNRLRGSHLYDSQILVKG